MVYGAVSAIGLTNNLTRFGQSVDQLITVDPRTGPSVGGNVAGIRNPELVGEAVNYYLGGTSDSVANLSPGVQVSGAQNIQVTQERVRRKGQTVLNHASVDDVTGPDVVQGIENKLKEILK